MLPIGGRKLAQTFMVTIYCGCLEWNYAADQYSSRLILPSIWLEASDQKVTGVGRKSTLALTRQTLVVRYA